MSMIETVNDVKNTCTFAGIGGKLQKLDAIEMLKKEFKLDGKFIIPINMKNHTGRPSITGTFYIYDDENLAKRHINPVIFKRLEKAKAAVEKPAEIKEEAAQEKPSEIKEEAAQEKPAEEEKS